MLDFEMKESQLVPRYHVMTCSKEADLEALRRDFAYLRSEALGKQAASYGGLGISVTVEEEIIAKESSFAVRLQAMPDPPIRPSMLTPSLASCESGSS